MNASNGECYLWVESCLDTSSSVSLKPFMARKDGTKKTLREDPLRDAVIFPSTAKCFECNFALTCNFLSCLDW